MGGAIAFDLAALGALMNNDKTLFRIDLCKYGFHLSSAGVIAVTWIDVNVERPQAKRTMIS